MDRSNIYERCVYTCPDGLCPGRSPLHPKEHYLPAGLGNFKDDVRLRNFICYECQAKFSKCEAVFLQNSTEAFFRGILGFKGRSSHASKNIFVDPTHGLPPLTVKGLHPTIQQELLWEMTSEDQAVPMHQVVFKRNDGSLEHLPIRSGKLVQDLRRFGEEWETGKSSFVSLARTTRRSFRRHLALYFMGCGTHPRRLGITRSWTRMRTQITLPYVQAISKIAFHFVLARFHFTGFESEFDNLKRFIYQGLGQNPARIVDEPLLPQLLPEEARLRQWSHIVTAEFDRASFVSRMQFFAGPRLKPFVWRVDIGKSPSRVLTEMAQGFRYFYYPQPDASGYVGAIEQLKLEPKMYARS